MFGVFNKKRSLVAVLIVAILYHGCSLTETGGYRLTARQHVLQIASGGTYFTSRPFFILFTIDDSGSMLPYQNVLATAAAKFVEKFQKIYDETGIVLDATVGVTTTTKYLDHNNSGNLELVPGTTLFKSKTEDGKLSQDFIDSLPPAMVPGAAGSGNEPLALPTIDALRTFFKPGVANPNFAPWAPGEKAVYLFWLSDENGGTGFDQSPRLNPDYSYVEPISYYPFTNDGNANCQKSIPVPALGPSAFYTYRVSNCPRHAPMEVDSFVWFADRIFAQYNGWTGQQERAFDVSGFALEYNGNDPANSSLVYLRQGKGPGGGPANLPSGSQNLASLDTNGGRVYDRWDASGLVNGLKTVSNEFGRPAAISTSGAYDIDAPDYTGPVTALVENNFQIVNGLQFPNEERVDINEPYSFIAYNENQSVNYQMVEGQDFRLDEGFPKYGFLSLTQQFRDYAEQHQLTGIQTQYTPLPFNTPVE